MSNTIRLQKTGNGDCVYMHKGKKLYYSQDTDVDTSGFEPLTINGEIKTIGTNAKFDKIGKSNEVGVTINKDIQPLYTKQRVGGPMLPIEPIENESMTLLKCNNAGEIIIPTIWSWICHKGKYCIPTKGEGTSYSDCKEKCGVTEDDNVNYILSITSIGLVSIVLLLFIFIVMFSNDINNSTVSFFKYLLVILFITAVILLSIVAYRLSN